MQISLGKDAKVYRNPAGTWAVPVWVAIDIVKNVTLNVTAEKWDAGYRGGGNWKAEVPTQLVGSVDIDMLHQSGDAGYVALETAFTLLGYLDILIADGLVATVGTRGLRAQMSVFDFGRTEQLLEGQMNKVQLAPTLSFTNGEVPQWLIT